MNVLMVALERTSSSRSEMVFIPDTPAVRAYLFKNTRRRGRMTILNDVSELSSIIAAGIVTKVLPVAAQAVNIPSLFLLDSEQLLSMLNNSSVRLHNLQVLNYFDKFLRLALLCPSVIIEPHLPERDRAFRAEYIKEYIESQGHTVTQIEPRYDVDFFIDQFFVSNPDADTTMRAVLEDQFSEHNVANNPPYGIPMITPRDGYPITMDTSRNGTLTFPNHPLTEGSPR